MNFLSSRLIKVILFFSFCTLFGKTRAQEFLTPNSFLDSGKPLVYNAVFQYKEYSFSGLMVLKKQEEDYRVVLLSKLGPTIMDFLLTENGLEYITAPEVMKKKIVANLMEQDFDLLVLQKLEDEQKIRNKGKGFKVKGKQPIKIMLDEEARIIEAKTNKFFSILKSRALFYHTNDDAIPDEICLSHKFVKMKIEMNLLRQ
ncbi:hypothetical protein [Fulvivirga sediminis]|uniref:Uncharacterized protein n=1 Tax=Fulvivirga sediminis TaxID=2803949 RepID=A0A937K1M2_9BACT|nr:hypothetical protein [Fulvivirga sediminis]MBL3656832.1 hypothetical protein [Fulvivirga sediminis]